MTRKQLLVSLVILISVVLTACEVPAPGTPLPTVTPIPSDTATSVPARQPTATPTVPAPSVTNTAAPAETATPTDTALVPPSTDTATPIDTPTFAPTETPVSGELWPPPPEEFSDYANAIVAYLNASPVHIVRLRAMLRDWDAITDRLGQVREADLDHDGELEWVVIIADPAPSTLTVPSELLVIDREGMNYEVLYQTSAESGGFQDNLELLSTQDVNADGRVDLGYTTTFCGAHTCFTSVHLMTWNEGSFDSLLEGEVEMPYAEVRLENRDADPALELLLHGGIIGSVGAGPQRARLDVYDWSGDSYLLSETIYDESDFLYFRILDANTALLAGDLTRAIALYQEAINNPDLRTWTGGEQEREDLKAFAHFRLALIYLLMQDEANAEAMAQALQEEQPEHVYTQATQVLLDYYGKEGTVTAACQAVTEFAYEHPETAEILANFGYANPTFTVDQVCPAEVSALAQ